MPRSRSLPNQSGGAPLLVSFWVFEGVPLVARARKQIESSRSEWVRVKSNWVNLFFHSGMFIEQRENTHEVEIHSVTFYFSLFECYFSLVRYVDVQVEVILYVFLLLFHNMKVLLDNL